MIAVFERDPGSFRDPSGYVYSDGQRVLRSVNARACEEYDAARGCGLLDEATERGLLIPSREAPPSELTWALPGARGEKPGRMLEHPRIPVISYPYEWTFSQLKDAALQHLDLHLLALDRDFELSDATAYNMQFDTGSPLHIDVLSLRRYRPGRPWEGYQQFCRQFVFPLLLESARGIAFQRMYRGQLDGLDAQDLIAMLPAWTRLSSLNMILHVQLHAGATRKASSSRAEADAPIRLPEIPKKRYVALLKELRQWIAGLRSGRAHPTYWAKYAQSNSYTDAETRRKHTFIRDTIARWGSDVVLDVGGNAGVYSRAALAAGASRAICADGDIDALEFAYAQRKAGATGLLPLVVDWCNPSPGQGWAGRERQPLSHRVKADAVLALALVHHIVISGNVPMREFVDQLFQFSRRVIVEFVPKSDPMVHGLLRHRKDVFDEYTEDDMVRLLWSRARIEQAYRIREDGRVLFACVREGDAPAA